MMVQAVGFTFSDWAEKRRQKQVGVKTVSRIRMPVRPSQERILVEGQKKSRRGSVSGQRYVLIVREFLHVA